MNELLCFLQQKSATTRFDHIVDIIDSFYNADGVFTARCTLVQSAVLQSHVVCLSVCL